MRLQIESKGVELIEKHHELIQQKLGDDIDKYLKNFDEDIKTADIRIEEGSRWGYKISFSMWLPKKEHIYAEEKDKLLENAINTLKDEIQRAVRKYKERLQDYHE